jgi:hypothetical protein
MPKTGHRLKDFLTAPILDPGIMDTVSSSDTLLDYQQQPTPDLTKVDTGPTEISVTVDIPGLAFEADGPFDHDRLYDPAAKGELKPKPIETEDQTEDKTQEETEKETQEETQEETDSDWSNVSRQKADRQNLEVDPFTPANATTPGPTLPDTIIEARSGGGGLLLLALAALLGD